jgi:ribosome-interacting GTPase 1
MDLKYVTNRYCGAILLNSRSLGYLIDRIWDDLGLVKVYTKKRGAHPDLSDPICMRKGSTVEVPAGSNPAAFQILTCHSGRL